MTTQEAIETTTGHWTHDLDTCKCNGCEAMRVLVRAAEENEKNAEDAEKWRAIEWFAKSDKACVANIGKGIAYRHDADRMANMSDEVVSAYRASQEEAAKKEEPSHDLREDDR